MLAANSYRDGSLLGKSITNVNLQSFEDLKIDQIIAKKVLDKSRTDHL